MKIYKYSLILTERQTIEMPAIAKIVHVNEQNGKLCIWAEVNPYDEGNHRTFRVVGTGFEIPEGTEYIGTCHMGLFAWHIYEEK